MSRNARQTEPDCARDHRRSLRATSTKPETLLWSVLRNRRLEGLKFRRQHSIERFVVDFACLERALIIEVDGGYHDLTFDEDQERQRFLEQQGFTLIRFSNEEVLENLEGVALAIRRALGFDTI